MGATACHVNGLMYTKIRSWEKKHHAAINRFIEK